MSRVWFISDHHLNHAAFLNFTDDAGELIRPFRTVEEMNEYIIDTHNDTVHMNDTVYFGGDVAMNQQGLRMVSQMNGKKVLIRGNHDTHKIKIHEYLKYFKDIVSVKTYNDDGFIVSHYPISSHCLWQHRKGRPLVNVHGHTHINNIPLPNYINMCVEPLDYVPMSLEELKLKVAEIHANIKKVQEDV